jgi:hypothetical protein
MLPSPFIVKAEKKKEVKKRGTIIAETQQNEANFCYRRKIFII